ncbi:MAG TPA: lipocalin family protein [Ferruginibacter sp.]|nr:lipocalin family protein [Ferruginibacter sp.]
MKKIVSITAMFTILLITACSKKDKELPVSKVQLLTSGTWKLTGVLSDNDGNGTYEENAYAGFLDCYKDNYYTFRVNYELELNEGLTKCAPSDPQTEMGNWQLTNNETNLVINTDPYSLEELNSNTLRIKETFGGNRSSMITFTKR